MAISFNGDDGVKFPDGSVKGSYSTPTFLGVGSYVFADTAALPNSSYDIQFGAILRGNQIYASDRAGSRDPNPVSTSATLWQSCGFATNTDRAVLWRRIE